VGLVLTGDFSTPSGSMGVELDDTICDFPSQTIELFERIKMRISKTPTKRPPVGRSIVE
jgi:hypothetical protein